MRPAHRERPAINRVLGKVRSFDDDLPTNLFINARDADKDHWLNLRQSLLQFRHVGTVGERDSAIEQRKIDVSCGDMRKREERNADYIGGESKAVKRTRGVRCLVA